MSENKTIDQNGPADVSSLALDKQLCFAVYSAAHAFNRTYKPLLDRFGLTYPQYLVLLSLWQRDGMTVKGIGQDLGLDSGTLSPLLKRLEAAGFVTRQRDSGDERQVIITLTEKGVDLKSEAFAIRGEIGRSMGCTAEEAGSLLAALGNLKRHLDENQQAE